MIRNIPSSYHSSDLRRFFTDFVESGRFDCFHFRHRPELKVDKHGEEAEGTKETRCCVVKIKEENVKDFMKRYHTIHWTEGKDGVELESRCLLTRIKVAGSETKDADTLSQSHLDSMLELRPPAVMPKGNVGTTTQHFLLAIQQCRLPAKIIAKLKLEFPASRKRRKYGNVEYSYAAEDENRKWRSKRPRSYLDRDRLSALNAAGPSCEASKEESGSDDDDDTCEEWERHEALHNDVAARRVDPTDISQQPGTKERLFEEEMEVTWEKGGSGLVFYTDAQVWKEAEGDFDERTTDDWDVDMSVYYEEGAGDKDARDSLAMRRAERNYAGKSLDSVFEKKAKKTQPGKVRVSASGGQNDRSGGKIGHFDRHTKGFGRRMMEKQGWKEGMGLGKSVAGMAEALDNEGQTDRSGLGYHGEAISRFVVKPPPGRKRTSIRDVMISTIYDNPAETDPGDSLKRTNPQTYLSHRKGARRGLSNDDDVKS